MRQRNNNKLCITMILGVIAIFLANCHNVNAAELTSFTGHKVKTTAIIGQPKKVPALRMPTIKMNQAADIALKLKHLVVVAK